MGKIKVLYKEVGKLAQVREIEDDYKVLQELCGGLFSGYGVRQFVSLPELHNVVLYCNDTGKLDGLPPNCFIGEELLVGNILFCAYDEHGEHMDITDEQITVLSFLCQCRIISKRMVAL